MTETDVGARGAGVLSGLEWLEPERLEPEPDCSGSSSFRNSPTVCGRPSIFRDIARSSASRILAGTQSGSGGRAAPIMRSTEGGGIVPLRACQSVAPKA